MAFVADLLQSKMMVLCCNMRKCLIVKGINIQIKKV